MVRLVGAIVSLHCLLMNLIMFCMSSPISRLIRDGIHERIHFFSSHFYSKLRVEGGVKDVERWTSGNRRNFKIFEMEKIFIPAHVGLNHWVLCVILNPEDPRPMKNSRGCASCILYFDSLEQVDKGHELGENLRLWLNHLWELTQGDSTNPFNKDNMPVIRPVGKSSPSTH